MKFQLKHWVWLRNTLITLFSIITLDFLLKKFYYHVQTSDMKFPLFLGLMSIISLQLQIVRQKKVDK
jgi:F0F1-type ATP synthase membrane subunit a